MKLFRQVPQLKRAVLVLAGLALAAGGFSAVAEVAYREQTANALKSQTERRAAAAQQESTRRTVLTARADQLAFGAYRESAAQTGLASPAKDANPSGVAQAGQALPAPASSNEPGIWSAIASTFALALFFLIRRLG